MIAIISDIHGNYTALQAVLSKIDELKIKEIYCLGDVSGYYSRINECCNELRKRNVKCVMGNHDWYMASGSFCPRSKSANDCMVYQRKVITNENKEWIRTFPAVRFEKGISMVHGGWINPIDEYLNPDEHYFEKIEGNIFVSGHTHVQRIDKFHNKIYCNPGSVGQPRDNDNRSAFAVYDNGEFELFRVEYDIEQVGKYMEQAGFCGYYYGCLRTGSKNLQW